MRKIAKVLELEMRRDMTKLGVPREEQVEWFTWLLYYLDFDLKQAGRIGVGFCNFRNF